MGTGTDRLRRRGPRWRHVTQAATVAVAVALTAGAVAIARAVASPVPQLRVEESSADDTVGEGREVRGVGTVIVQPDGTAVFCQGLYWADTTASDPGVPSCAYGPGVPLTGVTVEQMPHPRINHGVAWSPATVTGALTAGAVHVDRIDPSRPIDSPVEERPFRPEDPFRAVQALYTEDQLARAQTAINRDEELRARLPGRVLFAHDIDVAGQTVDVAITVDDQRTRDAIGQRYDLGMLRLRPGFEIVAEAGPEPTD
ncbi:MAG TPA: hypothetical protein VHF25_13720 [Nitriliruptorales bacterium]|nr:hypothetical protein [Nitriliruptorales bacterium]